MTQTFQRPTDFDVLAHVQNSLVSIQGAEPVEILMKTSLDHAQRVVMPELGILEETEEGVILRRAPYQLEWVAHFLLSLDFAVVVIRPQELRDILRNMATRAHQIVGDET
jgi:predicted DNA-binding transcriptional regulator YafY